MLSAIEINVDIALSSRSVDDGGTELVENSIASSRQLIVFEMSTYSKISEM